MKTEDAARLVFAALAYRRRYRNELADLALERAEHLFRPPGIERTMAKTKCPKGCKTEPRASERPPPSVGDGVEYQKPRKVWLCSCGETWPRKD